MTLTFKVNQQRGSWTAKVVSGAEALGLDRDAFVPVIVDDDDGRFLWNERRYHATLDVEHGAWWLRPEKQGWRILLLMGRPVLLRKGFDRVKMQAGQKVAVFRFANYLFGDECFTFDILERLGAAK